jgi:Mg/Co/Ni transporter MgtE
MDELNWITFEIESFKKQIAVLFILADEEEQNEILEELKELTDRRDKIIEERKKKM